MHSGHERARLRIASGETGIKNLASMRLQGFSCWYPVGESNPRFSRERAMS